MPRDEIEVAWAAGFFDGEGCVTTNGRRTLRVQVSQKRGEPLERLARTFSDIGGNIQSPKPNGVRDWVVYGPKAERVIERMWPYLSAPKREQFERVVSELEQRKAA